MIQFQLLSHISHPCREAVVKGNWLLPGGYSQSSINRWSESAKDNSTFPIYISYFDDKVPFWQRRRRMAEENVIALTQFHTNYATYRCIINGCGDDFNHVPVLCHHLPMEKKKFTSIPANGAHHTDSFIVLLTGRLWCQLSIAGAAFNIGQADQSSSTLAIMLISLIMASENVN